SIAEKVVQFRLSPLAILMIETVKPLSFLGNQLMVFFAPMVGAFTASPVYEEMTAFFEERSNLEMLIQKIEEVEGEWIKKEKETKEARKKARSNKRGRRK
ncbi:hypothetical protein KAX21_06550, partial [candidate division WOR-3 bacterium]|nr:hypothetical protein [candidate division WOR-3 bacterium]